MKPLLFSLSAAALLLTMIAPLLNASGKLDAPLMKHLLLAATLLWFIVWPAAIRQKKG